MNFNELKELIQLIDNTGLSSFQYQKDGLKLKIEKNDGKIAVASTSVEQVERPKAVVSTPVLIAEEPVKEMKVSAVAESVTEAPEKSGIWVNSPLVGVYYSAPNPSSPQFITVGQKVKKGDVLCIIEAMKVMNEIVAPEDGEVLEVKATNEKLVEFGEALVKIG